VSEENVEIVRRVYEAVARRDTPTVLAAHDPDIEWDLTRQDDLACALAGPPAQSRAKARAGG
jgi:ketosteroid isomerase-like protein